MMKFKKIRPEYSITICDKYSRFKPAHIRLKTLFDDIVNKFYTDGNISSLNDLERAEIAVEIINSSFEYDDFDDELNKLFIDLENKYFEYSKSSFDFLSFRPNLTSIIKSLPVGLNFPQNVIWLKKICQFDLSDIFELRNKYELLFPVEGVILCEGQTEYALLNTVFNLFRVNLNKLGFIVYPAGGKNQVARKYYELVEYLKLPIYILLDNDAEQTKRLIDAKLRKTDKLYLIKSGEFEDLMPCEILLKTINSIHNNDFNCNIEDFSADIPMSHRLELVYKKYGYGEFKKAQFAKELNEYILNNCTKADFVNSEISLIVSGLFGKN